MSTTTMSEMKAHIMAKAAADGEFRAKLLADPKPVIAAEFGITIPERYSIHVLEDDATSAHLVLPLSEQLTEEDLAQVAGGGDWADASSDWDNALRGSG